MGRAYAVREAKIKKTGAAKGKLYTNFAKEIYLVAKNGVPEIEANSALKHLIENDIRTVGDVRASFNQIHRSLGFTNSVSYNYDYLSILSFRTDQEEEIMMALLDAGVNSVDGETDENGMMNF